MSKSGLRTAASLVAAAALSVFLVAPAAVADEPRPSQAVAAKPAAASLKTLKARLRKAVAAKKKADAAVAAATKKLQAARAAGTPAVFAFQAASVALDEARAKHAPAKAALDRAQSLVANEGALWADLDKRLNAAGAGYQPLRQAHDAAVARHTELQNAVQSLRAQQSTASANQNDAAAHAASLASNDIPQAQSSLNAAWAREQQAFATKEAYREDFARRKAQWDATRKNLGHWEGLRDGRWRPVPGLDDAEALLDRAQAEYNQAKNQRADIEGYLNQLNARLAAVQADIAHWAAVVADLQHQIDAYAQPIADQAAAVASARQAMDAYFAQHVQPLYDEADQLTQDLKAAKADLPALVAAEQPLAAAVAQATAALAAAAPAQQSAQAAIDAASRALSGARSDLVAKSSKVRKLKKQIRKAKRRR